MMKIDVKYLPLGALGVYFCKILVLSPTWQDIGVVLVLSALSFFYQHKVKDEKLDELSAKFEEYDRKFEDQDMKIAENRQHLSSVKMANTVKGKPSGFGFGS